MYRVARYIDTTNLAEFFEAPVSPEPPFDHQSSAISLIYTARKRACEMFFDVKGVKDNRRMWEALRTISDTFRNFQSQTLTIEMLTKELESSKAKHAELERSLIDMVTKCSISYTSYQLEGYTTEKIVKGLDGSKPEIRDAVSRNTQLIKFIYCVDNILDSFDKDVMATAKQCLQTLHGHDKDPPVARKKAQHATMSEKSTPSKMDSERGG